MTQLVFDLTDYRDRFGGNVDEGLYRVQIDDIEKGESNAGNPMYTVYCRVVGGEFDGTILVDRLTQTEKALFRTVNFLNGLGIATPRKRLSFDLNSLIGRYVDVDVKTGEPYGNRPAKSEIQNYIKVRQPQKAEAVEEPEDLEEETTTAPAEAVAAKKTVPVQETTAEDLADLDTDEIDL